MRLRIIALLLSCALAVAGCGGQKPAAPATTKDVPQRVSLITTLAGDSVALDPATVKTNGPEVSLTLHFSKKAPRNGITAEVWEATFRPSERLQAIKVKRLLGEGGRELSADTAGVGWEYVRPASDSERIMAAVSEYCRSRGLPLDDTPPPYALSGYLYIDKSTANNAFYLYKPVSVLTSGGQKSVEVLMINETVKAGVKYSVATVTFKPKEKQYQTTAQSLYGPTGQKLSTHNDDKWYPVQPHSIYDMLLDAII
jgi:hypothetical protein